MRIEKTQSDWFYRDLEKDYKAEGEIWREIAEKEYDYMLEVLPPIYRAGGFLVSEPYDHSAEGEVYAGAVASRGKYYARLIPLRKAEALFAELYDALQTKQRGEV